MSAALVIDRHGIGGNNPPVSIEPTPYELSVAEIDGLVAEAGNWLDGEGVNSEAEAEAVTRLLDMLKAAVKLADERRITENIPFDTGKAEVQARYNLLIQDNKSGKGRAVLAVETCQAALTPYRARQDAERIAAAEAARREANALAEAAQAALRASQPFDLAAREEAEALIAEAKRAEALAAKAEKPVATGLRTTYRAEIFDETALARHAWEHHRNEMRTCLLTIAERQVRAGFRALPGVHVFQERVAR